MEKDKLFNLAVSLNTAALNHALACNFPADQAEELADKATYAATGYTTETLEPAPADDLEAEL